MNYEKNNGFFQEGAFQGYGINWVQWWLDHIKTDRGQSRKIALDNLERQAEKDALRLREQERETRQ